MDEPTLELARLIHDQCEAVKASLFHRIVSGRQLTPIALADIRRTLTHIVKQIDEYTQDQKS